MRETISTRAAGEGYRIGGCAAHAVTHSPAPPGAQAVPKPSCVKVRHTSGIVTQTV
jgi:hypothetical protein